MQAILELTTPVPDTHTARLARRLQTAEKRIRFLEGELAAAVRNERQRLSRELHDGVGQQLTALQFATRATLEDIPEIWRQQVSEISDLIGETTEELRSVARGLSPWWLDGYSLSLALHRLAARFHRPGQVASSAVCTAVPRSLDRKSCLHFYRIAQEAVHNAIRHGQARKIAIQLKAEGNMVALTVEDDGHGFSPSRVERGLGLRNMESRASALGAALLIKSSPGGGTLIACRAALIPRALPGTAWERARRQD